MATPETAAPADGHDEILTIGTMYPEELWKQLSFEHSDFYQDPSVKAAGLNPHSPLVQKLLKLSSGGKTEYPDNFNTRSAKDLGVSMEDLRSLGVGVYKTWLNVDVKDSKGQALTLDSGEFLAWQGTNPKSKIKGAPEKFADVALDALGTPVKTREAEYKAGDQDISIENSVGSRRIVGAAKFTTAPYTINYGNERIIDRDPKSASRGHPLLVGHDGELDVNIPDDVLKQIKEGKAYRGPVVIKCRDEEGRSDPKVFYLANPRDAVLAEAGNFDAKDMQPVTTVSGVDMGAGVTLPKSFIDYNNGDKAHYITMSGSQYVAWKYALSEHAELRDTAPDKWIKDQFGTPERFAEAFKAYGDGPLTRAQYHAAMDKNVAPEQTPVLLGSALKDVAPVTTLTPGKSEIKSAVDAIDAVVEAGWRNPNQANAAFVNAVENFIQSKDGAKASSAGNGKISEEDVGTFLTTMQAKLGTAEGRADIETLRTTLAKAGTTPTQVVTETQAPPLGNGIPRQPGPPATLR